MRAGGIAAAGAGGAVTAGAAAAGAAGAPSGMFGPRILERPHTSSSGSCTRGTAAAIGGRTRSRGTPREYVDARCPIGGAATGDCGSTGARVMIAHDARVDRMNDRRADRLAVGNHVGRNHRHRVSGPRFTYWVCCTTVCGLLMMFVTLLM